MPARKSLWLGRRSSEPLIPRLPCVNCARPPFNGFRQEVVLGIHAARAKRFDYYRESWLDFSEVIYALSFSYSIVDLRGIDRRFCRRSVAASYRGIQRSVSNATAGCNAFEARSDAPIAWQRDFFNGRGPD